MEMNNNVILRYKLFYDFRYDFVEMVCYTEHVIDFNIKLPCAPCSSFDDRFK